MQQARASSASTGFVRRFAKALRLGAYMRVIEPGELAAGDPIEVVERPEHGVTIEILGRILFGDRSPAPQALERPALSAEWRDWSRSAPRRRPPEPAH